ncbi:MAG TPA: chemotaxis protein CheB, partial [Gemmatimonadaceae bacterium]|nr:chemotaxis protein CheB [Gemmatimonadaceae bacterium]
MRAPASSNAKSTDSPGFPIVGIGASAGGLEAFTALLNHLPPDTGMAFVLVQHLDPQHESALTQLLARATSMPVREIASNTRVKADHVYVIPPNTDLSISRGILALRPRERTDRGNRSIDLFLESLAQDQGERAIGVILSGTASDGTLGLEAIKAEGGITFAQDDTARHDSMPRSAIAAGCVDLVLAPQGIAKELERIARHPYLARQRRERRPPAAGNGASATRLPLGAAAPPAHSATDGAKLPRGKRRPRQASTTAEAAFKKILLLLRDRTGVDFSVYKPATLQRRIARRMVLTKHEDPGAYATFLRSNRDEIDALYRDALINVTGFFRNAEAFDVLKGTVFSKALQRRVDQPYRAWVLGCSTGEEAYSIAMAFMEAADNAPHVRRLQLFATDLNETLLSRARHGLYARHLVQDVSPERL